MPEARFIPYFEGPIKEGVGWLIVSGHEKSAEAITKLYNDYVTLASRVYREQLAQEQVSDKVVN